MFCIYINFIAFDFPVIEMNRFASHLAKARVDHFVSCAENVE